MKVSAASVGPEVSVRRRAYRGFVVALMVGAAGALLSAVPSLFIQSIFIGEAQRCEEAQRDDIALSGTIETNCAANLNEAPVWLPPTIVGGGTLMGVVGGFAYGFFATRSDPNRRKDRERSWLPF